MTGTFDTILKGGTVVNHDGEGLARRRRHGGRIAAIGVARPGVCRRDDRLPRPARPAGRDRHPGAFPRAGPDAQGRPRNRLARRRDGRRHRRVRNAEHQSADRDGGDASPTRSRAPQHRMHCDFAFFIGGTRDNVARAAGARTRCRGCCGVKVFIGSSTGSCWSRTIDGLHRILEVIRRRAAFHAEDEYRLNERKASAGRGRSALASGLARRRSPR